MDRLRRARAARSRPTSFSDLIAGRVDPAKLRGRIVVVGATAPTLQDVHSTPTASDRLMSGPEIQANAISTALRGMPLREAPGWTGVLALLLLGTLPALAHLRTRGLKAAAVTPLAALAFAGVVQAAFAAGWIVTATYPLLALALGTLSTMTTAFVVERRERRRVDEHNDVLEQRVRERTAQLRETQLEIVQRLSQAAESRDGDTGEHIQRIRRMTHKLALAIGLPEDEAELIGHASAMHDVGKIGIPDRVLLKPGKLDADEWALMQSHTTIGADDPGRLELGAAADRRGDRADAPRALRRHRLPAGPGGRGDPARRAHHRDLRRLRRAALAARLQGALGDRATRSPSWRRSAGATSTPRSSTPSSPSCPTSSRTSCSRIQPTPGAMTKATRASAFSRSVSRRPQAPPSESTRARPSRPRGRRRRACRAARSPRRSSSRRRP